MEEQTPIKHTLKVIHDNIIEIINESKILSKTKGPFTSEFLALYKALDNDDYDPCPIVQMRNTNRKGIRNWCSQLDKLKSSKDKIDTMVDLYHRKCTDFEIKFNLPWSDTFNQDYIVFF